MNALEKFENAVSNGKHICVGLDTDIKKIPEFLRSKENPLFDFNKEIIDATHSEAAAYKLNFAFYEAEGLHGLQQLIDTIAYIKEAAPEVLVIGDAKRGDIGNTSKKYAEALFNSFQVDASTLHPYMGEDSLSPFLEFSDKLHFILVLTSNPGSLDFEKKRIENGGFLFQEILAKLQEWNRHKNCGIVFGATHVKELQENIDRFGSLPVLLPGVGAQGGDLEGIVTEFMKRSNRSFIINSSRGIIYKDNSPEFAAAASEELRKMNAVIASLYTV